MFFCVGIHWRIMLLGLHLRENNVGRPCRTTVTDTRTKISPEVTVTFPRWAVSLNALYLEGLWNGFAGCQRARKAVPKYHPQLWARRQCFETYSQKLILVRSINSACLVVLESSISGSVIAVFIFEAFGQTSDFWTKVRSFDWHLPSRRKKLSSWNLRNTYKKKRRQKYSSWYYFLHKPRRFSLICMKVPYAQKILWM